MDCCNYVQPYSMAGHHYYHQAMAAAAAAAQQHHHHQQQQQQAAAAAAAQAYYYDNVNAYAPYGATTHTTNHPATGAAATASAAAIEAASARYNCRLPPAYPNDYVYNPKEARLRKAMREQSREHSRSTAVQQHHQQQQQQQQQQSSTNSILTPNNRLSNGNNNNSHQQQQQSSSVGAGVSSLSSGIGISNNTSSSLVGGNGSSSSNRMIGAWFPLGHSAVPAASAPPTAVAAATAVTHPQQQPPPATHPKPILSPRVMAAHHQRSLEKTKDAMRKQLECSANKQSFQGNGVTNTAYHPTDYPSTQESDYCTVSDFNEGQKWHPYQNGVNAYHSRNALMSKMNSLHRGMQSATPHPASAWGQFCNVPFQTSQSSMMRSNRHMVYLQEQQNQQSQHCGYPDEMQMSYEAKMQDDLARRLHSSYSQEDQQMKSPLTNVHLGQLAHEEPKLNNGNSQSSCQEDGPRWGTPRPSSVSSSSCTTDTLLERETEPVSAPPATRPLNPENTKPLPGFQEAFGSTEMGRFSRSELFASLVEAANVSSRSEEQSNYESCNSRRSSSPEQLQTPNSSYGYANNGHSNEQIVEQVQPTMPRWHSPYAGAIGSEI